MTKQEMEELLDPRAFTGRSAHQVDAFVGKLRDEGVFAELSGGDGDIKVSIDI